MVGEGGIGPPTSVLSGQRSTTELLTHITVSLRLELEAYQPWAEIRRRRPTHSSLSKAWKSGEILFKS